MREIRYLYFCVFLVVTTIAFGQPKYYDQILKQLTSKKMAGRGYTYDGMEKASKYLAKEFEENNLKSFNRV